MKDKMKVYTLQKAQTRKRLTPENVSESRIDEHSKAVVQGNSEGISDEVYNLLHGNPFYFNGKASTLSVHSIEDFYIDVKKDTIPMGVVLRSGQFSPAKRRKWVKKALKKWKINFFELKDRMVFEGEQAPTLGKHISQTLPKMHYVSLAFVILLISFLVFFNGSLWPTLLNKTWFKSVVDAQIQAKSTSWFLHVSNAVVYMAIASILYTSLYNLVVGDLKKMDKTRQKIILSTTVLMDREFQVRYKVTSKYYLRRAGKRKINYSPLPIDKTMLKRVDLQKVEDLTTSFVKKASKVKKQKFTLDALKFLMVYLTYLGGAGVIGYYIYLIVKNIF